MPNLRHDKKVSHLLYLSGSKNRFAFWENVMVGFFIDGYMILLGKDPELQKPQDDRNDWNTGFAAFERE